MNGAKEMIETFHNDEAGYQAWHKDRQEGFVLNRFGGLNPAYNVMHRSDCKFLWRGIDEGSRTAVEKWCSNSEAELRMRADSVLGVEMWKPCGVCFRTARNVRDERRFSDVTDTIQRESGAQSTFDAVWIAGEPAVWVGSGEAEWKQQVTAALPQTIPNELPQWIDVEFRFLNHRLFCKDIDNLLTPILESARNGEWIERGFAWVGSVTARKIAVNNPSDVGALIKFYALPPELSHGRTGVLIEAPLPRLDESSVKWALYERAFALYQRRPDLRFPPHSPMSLEVRITIDDARRRKSIAALLKPCIDGLEPILGHPSNVLPEPREAIRRRLAPQDEMILSLAFHVRGGRTTEVSALVSPWAIECLDASSS